MRRSSLPEYFGVGCIHFVVDDGENISAGDWRAKVRLGLENLASVNSVNIDVAHFVRSYADERDIFLYEDAESFDKSRRPGAGKLSFRINIPKRIQEDLSILGRRWTGSESFEFTSIYSSNGVATFVRSLDVNPDQADPSHAVFVIRQFLERELARSGDTLRIVTVGPSPFHANFIIDENTSSSRRKDTFTARREHSLGYDRIHFSYAPESFSGAAEVCDSLFNSLAREFQLFYFVIRLRSREDNRARLIDGRARSLVEEYRAHGPWATIRRVFHTGSSARGLMLMIIDAKLVGRSDRRSVEEDIASFERSNLIRVIKDDIERQLAESPDYLIESAAETVRMLEEARKKEFEIFVISTSTFLGGAAGAITSLLAK